MPLRSVDSLSFAFLLFSLSFVLKKPETFLGFVLITSFFQSAMPEDSLIGAWKKSAHRLWAKRLRRSSTLSEITQVFILLCKFLFPYW